jgi:hypothetical protein
MNGKPAIGFLTGIVAQLHHTERVSPPSTLMFCPVM